MFPVLAAENVFSGPRNTFSGPIEVRRCHVTSDPRAKTAVRPLVPSDSAQLVRQLPGYAYTIDAEPAAGFLADMVPPEYTRTRGVDYRSVDYNSLFTHLWAAVQDLQHRVDRLEQQEPPKWT